MITIQYSNIFVFTLFKFCPFSLSNWFIVIYEESLQDVEEKDKKTSVWSSRAADGWTIGGKKKKRWWCADKMM